MKRRNSYKTTNSETHLSNSPISNTRDVLGDISRDCAVFLKNQIKKDIINCSGYNVGDNGCKALFQLKIKSNCDKSINTKCTELKMSNCNITDNGMKYISALLDLEGTNIRRINLSKNFISDSSLGHVLHILNKNSNILEIKISNNLLSEEAKQKIGDFCNKNGRRIKVDL